MYQLFNLLLEQITEPIATIHIYLEDISEILSTCVATNAFLSSSLSVSLDTWLLGVARSRMGLSWICFAKCVLDAAKQAFVMYRIISNRGDVRKTRRSQRRT